MVYELSFPAHHVWFNPREGSTQQHLFTPVVQRSRLPFRMSNSLPASVTGSSSTGQAQRSNDPLSNGLRYPRRDGTVGKRCLRRARARRDDLCSLPMSWQEILSRVVSGAKFLPDHRSCCPRRPSQIFYAWRISFDTARYPNRYSSLLSPTDRVSEPGNIVGLHRWLSMWLATCSI